MNPSRSPRADAEECARITAHHARTFSLASRLLPDQKRRAANALYAFCRLADDLVDQQSAVSPATLRTQLEDYRQQVQRALRGDTDSAVLRELAWVVHTYDIPAAPLFELIDGVGRDLTPRWYARWEDVSHYCEGVASSVGEMCTYVFGVTATRHTEDRFLTAVRHARTLGRAMQLTNILRDIGEDAHRGRCYLPMEELARFGLTVNMVLQRSPDLVQHEGWVPLMQFQIARARELYAESTPGIAMLDADAQRCAIACAEGYAGILTAIETQQYDTISRRARVDTATRFRLLWKAWRYRPVVPLAPYPPASGGPLREAHLS